MSTVQLVAIDLDGTLLNPYGTVSEENKKAITKARNTGMRIVIATGRSVHSALRKLEHCEIDGLVTCNGTVWLDPQGKVIKEYCFTNKEMLILSNWLKKERIFFEAFTNDGYVVTNNSVKRYWSYFHMAHPYQSLKHIFAFMGEMRQFQQQWFSFKRYPIDTTKYVKVFAWDKDADKLKRIRERVPKELDVHITDSGQNIEIIPKSCSKYRMIHHLAESWEIPDTGIAAIGDSNNDREMLIDSHIGIAMGNASDELKALSNWTTKTNAEDGVAYAIECLLKENKV